MIGGAGRAHSAGPWFDRSGELAVAFGLIILLLPLMIVVAIAIKCDSRGPVLVWEQRTSPCGRRFWALKFRSTVRQTGASSYDEPEATFVGGIIYALRIDTLPQLVNVLRREMTCLPAKPDRLFFLE